MQPEKVTYQGKYIEFYHLYPDRPVIVFLHDSLGCVRLWRDFPLKVAEQSNCNVLIYDRLGYGQSESMPTYIRPVNYMEAQADTLNDMLIHLQIENAVLFGHSDGGTIALWTAAKYPARIKAVICEAAHIFVEEVTLSGIREAMISYKTTNLAEKLARYHGDKVDTLFKAWAETWTREDYRDWNIEYLLPDIHCPVLFIQGEADEYGTLAQVEKTVTQVSGPAEKYMIPDIGHTPHKESPDLVLMKSVAFIENIAGRNI